MEIVFFKQRQADIAFGKKSGNKAIINLITTLLVEIAEDSFTLAPEVWFSREMVTAN